ncbi:mitochondrial proton/calcium exchanger protein-like [Rhopilema esculentum]|uniref:mitochondrial proton/calcium exchanger protein-like n=1 Tax=Rhopilema esculentum TaxID=499914 RepID=UPI0031E1CC2E
MAQIRAQLFRVWHDSSISWPIMHQRQQSLRPLLLNDKSLITRRFPVLICRQSSSYLDEAKKRQIKISNDMKNEYMPKRLGFLRQNLSSRNSSFLTTNCTMFHQPLSEFRVVHASFHTSALLNEIIDERKIMLDDKSKVEEYIEHQRKKRQTNQEKMQLIEEKLQEAFIYKPEKPKDALDVREKLSIKDKIMKEVMHYYDGFKLLYLDTRVAAKLLWRVLNGEVLLRRERRQFRRTVADLLRLVPFMVFLIIPFMEFLLPVAIKLFPNMLPSTFEDKSKKEEARKKSLKLKLSMAQFLQDTIEELEVSTKTKKSEKRLKEFANFVQRIRSEGEQPSNDEIIRYSKLFEDEITLENLTHPQLKALCRLLMMSAVGTSNYLRFTLKMKLQELKADDKLIRKEGLDKLSTAELQQACVSRGMRGVGVPVERLKSQLKQWLELSLNEEVPATLLLLSRLLYISDHLTSTDQLKVTLSQLPERVVDEMEIKIGNIEGEQVNRRTRIDILTDEEEKIRLEREQLENEKQKKEKERVLAEELKDKAALFQDTLVNLKGTLSSDRDELNILKEERKDYQEGLKELAKEALEEDISESAAGSRLGKRLDDMIEAIHEGLDELEDDSKEVVPEIDADRDGKITTQELLVALRKNDGLTEEKALQLCQVLDIDNDGTLDLDELKRVVELIEREDMKISDEQVAELLMHIKRGEDIVTIEQMLAKEKSNAILRFVRSAYNKRKVSKR